MNGRERRSASQSATGGATIASPTVTLLTQSAASLAFPMTPRSNAFTEAAEQGQLGWMSRDVSA